MLNLIRTKKYNLRKGKTREIKMRIFSDSLSDTDKINKRSTDERQMQSGCNLLRSKYAFI